jgi:hypothetical protein
MIHWPACPRKQGPPPPYGRLLHHTPSPFTCGYMRHEAHPRSLYAGWRTPCVLGLVHCDEYGRRKTRVENNWVLFMSEREFLHFLNLFFFAGVYGISCRVMCGVYSIVDQSCKGCHGIWQYCHDNKKRDNCFDPKLWHYHLYLTSIIFGIILDKFKTSRTVPVFKANNRKLCNNYRPISLLSSSSNILEKLIAIRLMNHLELNNLLYEQQYSRSQKKAPPVKKSPIFKILFHRDNIHSLVQKTA